MAKKTDPVPFGTIIKWSFGPLLRGSPGTTIKFSLAPTTGSGSVSGTSPPAPARICGFRRLQLPGHARPAAEGSVNADDFPCCGCTVVARKLMGVLGLVGWFAVTN